MQAWRAFAKSLVIEYRGTKRTWADHVAAGGGRDEVTIVQPVAFPKFAEAFLSFEVGVSLAPEVSGQEGKPDFTPADALTHPFVFETKATDDRNFASHEAQILRYLTVGRPRIRQVVVTNLASIEVFALGQNEALDRDPRYSVDLRFLLAGSVEAVAPTGHARRFAAFLDAFKFRELDAQEKLDAIRRQEEWSPGLEVTSPDWVSRRVDAVVQRLTRNVAEQVASGALEQEVDAGRRAQILGELRDLEWRLGGAEDAVTGRSLNDYLSAAHGSEPEMALRQYVAHTAYFSTTRMLIVRIWEDLRLLSPVLYDGGFDHWMEAFQEVVRQVLHYSFDGAARHYPSLYERGRANNYTWFTPDDETLVDVIYDLANTYMGEITSDVLGTVYERMLERIDRKRIGQFYTPRDIIKFIWDLIGFGQVAEEAEGEDRALRVFDIATGSGGFLVEAARRLRDRALEAIEAGADLDRDEALAHAAEGLVGAEIQRFSAYLAEVNLLVQLGYLIASGSTVTIPTLGILCKDSMELHEPDFSRLEVEDEPEHNEGLLGPDASRADVYWRVKSVGDSDFEFDVACGNPPYVGEKTAADTLARTRARLPYWEQFSGARLDLLYWFLILGVSKLRENGRFGFITSEYWLRSEGAEKTRKYLAQRCHIERIVLLRKLKPFPDAPGHDSMIITGRRVAPADHVLEGEEPEAFVTHRPLVSIYTGPNVPASDREVVLDVLREGARGSGVRTFAGSTSPNDLGGNSWHEVILTGQEARRRRTLARNSVQLEFNVQEGVIATPVRLKASDAEHLTQTSLRDVGGADSKHGIFALSPAEIDALGALNGAEEAALKPIVNTKDVLPYATVLPPDADRMVYLARNDRDTRGMSVDQVHRTPFPGGMPALERHMARFESLLLHKVGSYRTAVRRPWWEVHNHRPDIMIHDRDPKTHKWANYALAARWGLGGGLIASMAPAGSVPASGMQVLTSEQASAAYIVGLLNSSVGQELVGQMPPGVMQQDLLERLPLPFLPEVVEAVGAAAEGLADTVATLAAVHGSRWPRLLAALSEDIALADVPFGAWDPEPGPSAQWGKLANVNWIEATEPLGGQAQEIRAITEERDLFGTYLRVIGRSGELHVRLDKDDDSLLDVLSRHVAGLAARRGQLRDVPALLVPIADDKYIKAFVDQADEVNSIAEQYRRLRDDIDQLLAW